MWALVSSLLFIVLIRSSLSLRRSSLPLGQQSSKLLSRAAKPRHHRPSRTNKYSGDLLITEAFDIAKHIDPRKEPRNPIDRPAPFFAPHLPQISPRWITRQRIQPLNSILFLGVD